MNINESIIAICEEKMENIDFLAFEEDVNAAQEETNKLFSLIENYMILTEEYENLNEEEDSIEDKANELFEKIKANSSSLLMKFRNGYSPNYSPIEDKSVSYAPEGGVEELNSPTLKDLLNPAKWPMIIIAIVKWIKSKVIYFLGVLVDGTIRLLGGKSKIDLDELKRRAKFSAQFAKRIEVKGTPLIKDKKANFVKVQKVDSSFFNEEVRYEDESGLEGKLIESSDIICEGLSDVLAFPSKEEKNAGKPNGAALILSIDLSKDLMGLRETLQHFFNLYDNSYGSNGEKLFDTADLEAILEVIERISTTGDDTISVLGTSLQDIEVINSSRVRENLVNTKINTDNLKNAFRMTSNKVTDFGRIIGNKELMMAADSGIAFKFYSENTYNELSELIAVISPRMKAAKEMRDALKKLQKDYAAIADKLEKKAKGFPVVGNVSFASPYERKMKNFLDCTRDMTQITTLRLTTLEMYIQELEKVLNCINSVASFTAPEKKGSFLSKIF